MLSTNLTVGENGHLYFGGQDTVDLARQYGTPLYVMDEVRVRENMRMYVQAFRQHFGGTAMPLYASKANSFKRIYEIAREEGMGIDVVSSGEIYTAMKAGYPLSQAYFHSNNKTDWEIAFAMDNHDAASSMAQMLLHLHAKEAQLVLMFLHIVHAIAVGG